MSSFGLTSLLGLGRRLLPQHGLLLLMRLCSLDLGRRFGLSYRSRLGRCLSLWRCLRFGHRFRFSYRFRLGHGLGLRTGCRLAWRRDVALGRRRGRCVNGPNDRMLDVDGFDDRRRDIGRFDDWRRNVGRFQPRLRIGLVAAGGDTAGVRESNAGNDRRKNQFHNVLVHVRPPFVLTLSKEDLSGKSDKTAWNDATGVQRDIYAESNGFSRRERNGRKAHAAQSTCLRSLTR